MKTFFSSLEPLEARIAPANITCSVVGHALKILGTDDGNSITIDGNADPTTFLVTSSTDMVNGAPGATGFTTPSGVTSISVKLLDGNDTLTISKTIAAVHLTGTLMIDGGNGTNTITANEVTVDKNVTITNGNAAMGTTHQTVLTNVNIGGSLNVRSLAGNTVTSIGRNVAGLSTIRGSITVTNGVGADYFILTDTNVGGSVTVKNGHGDATSGGYTEIYNTYNPAKSVIGGNITVTYLDGSINYDGIWDTNVLGNVTLNHGSGAAHTHFDGYTVNEPVVIRGNLKITGTGATNIDVGLQYKGSGLIVSKAVTVTSKNGDTDVRLNKLQAGGAATFAYGSGTNITEIDDSIFAGTFKLTGGTGMDTINIETGPGTSLQTVFEKAVTVLTGAGTDSATFAGAMDGGQFLYAYRTFVTHGLDATSIAPLHIVFPFGGHVQLLS